MNDQTYDIVLLPGGSVTQKAIRLSEKLSQHYDTRFTLGKESNYPHYSLYMAQLDKHSAEKAKHHLAEIASAFPIFDLEATKYWQDPEEGFFEIQYKRTPALIALQNHIIASINPLRKGRFLDFYPPGYTKEELEKQLTGNALEQLYKYGYPEIGEDYRPHMTFTRLTQSAIATTIDTKLPPITEFSGIYPRLGLYVMGPNGTCVEKIAVFPLG